MHKLSIKQILMLSATLVGALLLFGNLIVWNSNASLAAAAEEASRIEQSIRAFKDTRFHVVQIQQFMTDAAAVGEADFPRPRRNARKPVADWSAWPDCGPRQGCHQRAESGAQAPLRHWRAHGASLCRSGARGRQRDHEGRKWLRCAVEK
jgi:hypothetical protein